MNDSEIVELLVQTTTRQLPPIAFSLDDVVQQGHRVRRRRAISAVTASVVAVLLVAAGFAVLRPQSRVPSPAPAASSVSLETQIDTLLVDLGVPEGATVLPSSPTTVLDFPDSAPTKGIPFHRALWWTSPMTPAAMSQWAQTHQPPTANGSYQDSANGIYRLRYQIGMGDPAYGPMVDLTVVAFQGGSATRVDVWASAPPPRQADTLISPTVTSVSVRVGPRSAAGQPYSSALTLSFDGGKARTLAEVLNALTPASADLSCTVPTSAPTFTFRDRGHLLEFTHASSCGLVLVLVDGKPRASLLAGGPELDGTIASLNLPAA